MTIFYVVMLLVLLQRAGELMLARANTLRLLRRGGTEIDRGGYKWFVVLHAAWLAALVLDVPSATLPVWPLLALFGVLQLARVWVISSLGRRWTTRLIVLPGVPPVTRGPYRWVNHPNYLIVAGELAILPMAFSAIAIAAAFSACNLLLIVRRIRLEDAAIGSNQLSHSRNPAPP